jgi:Tfp pilus assembly protein PilF
LLLALLPGLAACGQGSGQKPLLRLADLGSTEASFEEGRRLLDRGHVAKAVTAFRAALRRDGPTAPVLNGLAIAYAELGRPAEAADMFSRALAIAPDDPATLNNIGFAALRRADTVLARLYLERAERQGSSEDKIGGNLARLARLETTMHRHTALPGTMIAKADAASPFSVERLTASAQQLNGLQQQDLVASAAFRRAAGPSGEAATLIDFAGVVDPWATAHTLGEGP